MKGIDIVLTIISTTGTFSSIVFAMLAFKRNDRGGHKQEEKMKAFFSDVGYIKSSIDKIEKSIDKLEEGHAATKERLTKLETEVRDHINNSDIHKSKGGQ